MVERERKRWLTLFRMKASTAGEASHHRELLYIELVQHHASVCECVCVC